MSIRKTMMQKIKCWLGFHKWGEEQYIKNTDFSLRKCMACSYTQRIRVW